MWFAYVFNKFVLIRNILVGYPEDDRDSDRNMWLKE